MGKFKDCLEGFECRTYHTISSILTCGIIKKWISSVVRIWYFFNQIYHCFWWEYLFTMNNFCLSWLSSEPKQGKIERTETNPSAAASSSQIEQQEKEEHQIQPHLTQPAPSPSQMQPQLTQPAPPPSQAQPQLTQPAPPAEQASVQKAVVENIPLEGITVVPHEGNYYWYFSFEVFNGKMIFLYCQNINTSSWRISLPLSHALFFPLLVTTRPRKVHFNHILKEAFM